MADDGSRTRMMRGRQGGTEDEGDVWQARVCLQGGNLPRAEDGKVKATGRNFEANCSK